MYRIASVLLILFAAGHTLGFRQILPSWGVDTLVASMKTIRFDVQGFSRTYYDFYLGFGLFVSVLQLFAALVCWQLGLLEAATLRSLSLLRWSMVICFLGVSYLSWQYFFMVPIVFSLAITLFLVLGAWLANKPA
jgi:hypothetical protein